MVSNFSGSIVGARTLEYLLEKSRMVTQVNMIYSGNICYIGHMLYKHITFLVAFSSTRNGLINKREIKANKYQNK